MAKIQNLSGHSEIVNKPKHQNSLRNSFSKMAESKQNCPWSIPVDPGPTTSLKDVMSEQLASDLQAKEQNPESSEAANRDSLTDEELAKILSEDQGTSGK